MGNTRSTVVNVCQSGNMIPGGFFIIWIIDLSLEGSVVKSDKLVLLGLAPGSQHTYTEFSEFGLRV